MPFEHAMPANTSAARTHSHFSSKAKKNMTTVERGEEDKGTLNRCVPLIVVLIAVLQVSASEVTGAVQRKYEAPFCIMWIHAVMLSPLYFVSARLRGRQVNTDEKACLELGTAAKLVVLFFGANYAYVRALRLAPASYVQAVFGTAPALVVLLSRFWLGEQANILRWLGVLLAFCGIALLALSSEEEERQSNALSSLFGLLLAQVAVLNAAVYKVFFKKRFGAPAPSFVLLIIGLVGILSAVLGAPIAVILVLTKVEDPPILRPALWTLLLAGGLLDVLYNTFIALGLALAESPVYIAIATILAVPLSAAVDAILYSIPLSWIFVLGTLLVLLSFALVSFASSLSALSASSATKPQRLYHSRIPQDDNSLYEHSLGADAQASHSPMHTAHLEAPSSPSQEGARGSLTQD